MKIILASSSQYRKDLLSRIVKEFTCISPDIDEESIKTQDITPEEMAHTLSEQKGRKIFGQYPNDIIISSDQLISFENKIIGKAHHAQNAIAQLESMNNKTHSLITAFHVFSPHKIFSAINKTTLKMRNLSPIEIKNYVDHDNPIDCAGSYKLELKGIALFEEIKSDDFTAIQGLPLIKLTSFLRELEVNIFNA